VLRSLKWGGILGMISVTLALIDTIIWTSLHAADETQVFEYAYLINVLFYVIAGIVAARLTGYIRLGILDALIAAVISGTIGTISQALVFHPLDAATFIAVIVMTIIELVSAVPFGALGGGIGRLIRRSGPARAIVPGEIVGEAG
jgi:uncharacterized membrane protein YjjP (DUF1212 family)